MKLARFRRRSIYARFLAPGMRVIGLISPLGIEPIEIPPIETVTIEGDKVIATVSGVIVHFELDVRLRIAEEVPLLG